MGISKTKHINRVLLLFKSKPKSCVANKITLHLSLQFKSNNPVLCKRKRGAKIKGKKPTNICAISLQTMMTQRAKSIKIKQGVEPCSRQEAKTILIIIIFSCIFCAPMRNSIIVSFVDCCVPLRRGFV